MLRVAVVDDEPPARRHLVRMIGRLSDVQIVAEADSGPKAVDLIQSAEIDLVLLDIQMPGMTGFDVIDTVGPELMPATIFVTAYDAYAVKAFEVGAIDYVMKPVTLPRLQDAVQRVRARSDEEGERARKLMLMLEQIGPRPRYLERLVVHSGERVLLIPVAEVTHFRSAANYVEAFTPTGSYLVRETLQRLEKRLDPHRFARIHRTAVVSIDAIRELSEVGHGDATVYLTSGVQLRVSRRYRSHLLERAMPPE